MPKITRSTKPEKKFKVVVEGKEIHFGAKGYRIGKVGSAKWRSYCARSAGIKGADDPKSANYWSRKQWKC
jgi:hypothetical protein